MPVKLFKGEWDDGLRQVQSVFEEFIKRHRFASVEFYRAHPMSIRVRIVDPYFRKMSYFDRVHLIWDELRKLPNEIQQDVSLLVLLLPYEVERSEAYREFERPLELLDFNSSNRRRRRKKR